MADRASTFLLVTVLALSVILLIFAMKYFASLRTARMAGASEAAYRDLAARAAKSQEESAASLSRMEGRIADIKARLALVQKVLTEVE